MMNGDDIRGDSIRSMIKNENDLVNHRLTWLGTFQGLLLAALAFAWGKSDAAEIVMILCVLGALVALSTGVATCRANQAIKRLDAQWDQGKPADYAGPDVEGVRSHEGWFWFLMPGYFLPWLFFFAWIGIAFIHLNRCG
jgi:hypothetical protein